MQDYLTITEAIAFTKKSKSTIRRFVNAVVSDPQSKHRDTIRPTPEEVERFKADKQPFQWTISRGVLQQEFIDQPTPAADVQPAPSVGTGAAGEPSLLFTILEHELHAKEKHLNEVMGQLKVKDDQIARLNNTVDSLNERLREGNVLIGTLQQRLALTPATERPSTVVVGAAKQATGPVAPQPAAGKKSGPAAAKPRPKTAVPKKRSWLQGLFTKRF